MDALLLADFAQRYETSSVLDVGAGCGVIALAIAGRNPASRVHAVERQPALFACLATNVEDNSLQDRVTAVHADVRGELSDTLGRRFDQVVMNPPYFGPAEGRRSPNVVRAEARHQIHGSLFDLLSAATSFMKPRGSLSLVYPARRLDDLLEALTRVDLSPRELSFVHPHPHAGAHLVLVNAARENGLRARQLPPIFLSESPSAPMGAVPATRHRTVPEPRSTT